MQTQAVLGMYGQQCEDDDDSKESQRPMSVLCNFNLITNFDVGSEEYFENVEPNSTAPPRRFQSSGDKNASLAKLFYFAINRTKKLLFLHFLCGMIFVFVCQLETLFPPSVEKEATTCFWCKTNKTKAKDSQCAR